MEQLRIFGITICICICLGLPAYAQVEWHQLEPDLQVPEVVFEKPAPGKRVRQVHESYRDSDVHHTLYLPTDWKPGQKYPVIVEYAGNAWRSSLGTVEGSALGYGISGGSGVIWLCLPFVDMQEGNNAKTWWGDVDATVDYCLSVVEDVCTNYGGDSSLLFIAGFSRGAIACNYIGLHDDEIASLWRGFICHSHYDGVRQWDYGDSDPLSASDRLERLQERPQFVSHEASVDETRDYLTKTYPKGDFTFLSLPFADHTDKWVLYDLPERDTLRVWFSGLLKDE